MRAQGGAAGPVLGHHGTRGTARPLLGAHTAEVLAEIGYDRPRIEALRAAGVWG